MTPANPAITHAGTADRSGLAALRPLFIAFALLSLLLTWVYLGAISRADPWYRNADMNLQNMVDALSINSDVVPQRVEQPGFFNRYLLALDYRVRHYAGVLPVWNLKKFSASRDPLGEIRTLVQVGRMQSRVLVLLFILSAATLSYVVVREIETACLTVILLGGSSGLLFHGLLTRPELLCAWLGGVLALWCTWRGVAAPPGRRHHFWLFLAGLCVGFSVLAQLPGIFYLAVCFAWCWMSAVLANGPENESPDQRRPSTFHRGLLPTASSLTVLWLAHSAIQAHAALGPVAALRLRVAAVLIGVVPLLDLRAGGGRFRDFLLGRVRELTLLGGGALAAIPVGYLALRCVMTAPQALGYLGGLLNVIFDPDPFLKTFLAAKMDIMREFARFVQDTPFLWLLSFVATLAVMRERTIPARLKGLIALLFASALVMTLLLCQGHFLAQYGVFPQVPLLLLSALSVSALTRCSLRPQPAARETGWPGPVILTAAAVLAATVYLRLQQRYASFQPDSGRPVIGITVTLFYEHNAYPRAYVQTMAEHYGDRKHFIEALERYLDDPANR